MVAVVLSNPHKPQRPLSVIPKLGLYGRCGSFKSTQTAKTIIGYTKTWSIWSPWFFQIHTNHKDHYRLYQNLVYMVAVVLLNPHKQQRPLSVIPKLGLYGRRGSFKSKQTCFLWSLWFFRIYCESSGRRVTDRRRMRAADILVTVISKSPIQNVSPCFGSASRFTRI